MPLTCIKVSSVIHVCVKVCYSASVSAHATKMTGNAVSVKSLLFFYDAHGIANFQLKSLSGGFGYGHLVILD